MKHYTRTLNNLTELLDEVAEFEEKMEGFMIKYPYYNYSLELDYNEEKAQWVVDLKIERYERATNKNTKWDTRTS